MSDFKHPYTSTTGVRSGYNAYDHKGNRSDQYRLDSMRQHNNDNFSFGVVNSLDYGVYITGIDIGGAPKRDVSFVQVAGRNGDLVLDNKRWKNIEVTYHCAIVASFAERFDRFKNELFKQIGYRKLADTIYPLVYREAILVDGITPESLRLNQSGRFDLTFNCKPQRYIMESQHGNVLKSSPGAIENWGEQDSKPIITVYGTGAGTLTVNGTTVEILALTDEITIDCDLMNAYRKVGDAPAENKNNVIYAPEFPVLQPGRNIVSWTGDISSVKIHVKGWFV